jgi:hypothetical protein
MCVIAGQTPFNAANDDFSMAVFLKPTLVNDGAWHGFLGYQDGTRSPSLWVNFNGCDVGFCDCSSNLGGRVSGSGAGDMPEGDCAAAGGMVQACSTAGCCDCSSANTGNSGDGISGNGMHWDTRTTQEVNGNEHGGQRFAGVADNYFVSGQYTHVVWTKAGQVCSFYKNGQLTDTTTCPTHVDLHETYEIGHVDNFFQGVIDEVSFYTSAMASGDVASMYAMASAGMMVFNAGARYSSCSSCHRCGVYTSDNCSYNSCSIYSSSATAATAAAAPTVVATQPQQHVHPVENPVTLCCVRYLTRGAFRRRPHRTLRV